MNDNDRLTSVVGALQLLLSEFNDREIQWMFVKAFPDRQFVVVQTAEEFKRLALDVVSAHITMREVARSLGGGSPLGALAAQNLAVDMDRARACISNIAKILAVNLPR